MNNIDEVVARLIQRVDSHYYGKYRGQVIDNNDPSNLGRIKANVPRVLGVEDSGWALPAFAYGGASEQGFFAVPDVGAGVWIEFEGGDLSYPIWSGTWYTSGDIPESAQPGKKVLKTKSGHKLVLDDDGGTLEITDSNGNTVSMDSSTVKVAAGNATKVVIDAPQIELVENSTHPVVLGDELLQYLQQIVQVFQSHMHPGETTPVGGPVTPMPPTPPMPSPTSSLLSTKVNTG
ncbi:MAG TPA: phage baseplate assembly protein V [Alloacidobacterium sp.]|nr:phage baseplate assembly protein V [Alloacidobacterium sp.]